MVPRGPPVAVTKCFTVGPDRGRGPKSRPPLPMPQQPMRFVKLSALCPVRCSHLELHTTNMALSNPFSQALPGPSDCPLGVLPQHSRFGDFSHLQQPAQGRSPSRRVPFSSLGESIWGASLLSLSLGLGSEHCLQPDRFP